MYIRQLAKDRDILIEFACVRDGASCLKYDDDGMKMYIVK